MQFTTKFKYIILFILILLNSVFLNAQETDSIPAENISDTTEINKEKKKFKLFKFFKKKDKSDNDEIVNEDDEQIPDTAEDGKTKKRFFDFFKRNNKNDSVINDSLVNDSLNNDSTGKKEKFRLFRKNKNDSTSLEKPERISLLTWNKKNYNEQDTLLRAWDDYDKEHYKTKKRFSFSKKEVAIAIKLKKNRNLYERIIYKRARKKPFKYRKKIINRQNSRYKKTLRFDRLNKSETAPSDSVTDARRYQIVNKRYKREAKKEAIRKNKILIRFDRKEDRIRQRYELSDNEVVILNKGRGMRLKGSEKIIFKKARKKQEKFTEKLVKIRKKRVLKLQSSEVRKRMKNKQKALNKNKNRNNFFKKKKKKSEKHDSDEYPKRYHK